MTFHFDHILCGAIDAETAFEEGRRDGDFALLHIDDLRSAIRVLRAATHLVDDTEFDGRHHVPEAAWESLAAALRGEDVPTEAASPTGDSDKGPGASVARADMTQEGASDSQRKSEGEA